MNLPDLPETTVAAFATLCGATVVVTRTPDVQENFAFTWSCLGCGKTPFDASYQAKVTRDANHHAGLCRSVPLPTS